MTPSHDLLKLEHKAHRLASRMPSLLVEAGRIANTLAHGIHGRKRRGPGETFWQFRPYGTADSAQDIDWRRSATSDRLFVREREWEAAHTLWLWPDLSPSMRFRSHLTETEKRDRALVLTFAISELLVRAGERIGIPGLMPPTNQYNAPQKLAHTIAAHADHPFFDRLPSDQPLRRFSEVLMFSDFLSPPEQTIETIRELAGRGVRGHLVQVLDPAEESLPYRGRVKFESMEGGYSYLAGRAQDLADKYSHRLQEHREAIRSAAQQHRFSFMVHHTDRPAVEALLALHSRLGTSGIEDFARSRSGDKPTASNGGAAT
jgi:uncharacterized protein (DUF58 family)